MRRSTHKGRVASWRYGERHERGEANRDPATPEAMEQLWIANCMWNALVEADHAHEQRVAELWGVHPTIAVAVRTVEKAVAAITATDEKLRSAKARDHAISKELRATKRESVAALRLAKASEREMKQVAQKAMRPAFDESLTKLRADTRQVVEEARVAGLYWGTRTAVLARFDIAVSRIRSHRISGERANLRFHRFDGTGTWTTQIMRKDGEPERTYAALASGTSMWRNLVRFEPPPDFEGWDDLSQTERRRRGRTTVAVRIASHRQKPLWLHIPIAMHRPIPPEADISSIEVTRKRIGTHFRYSVAFTLRLPPVELIDRPGIAALNLGWRRLRDGTIRLAVISTRDGQPLRHDLCPDWLRVDPAGSHAEVIVPIGWQNQWKRTEKITSLRDIAFNLTRDKLASWLDDHPPVAALLTVMPNELRQWRSKTRLARLVIAWRANRIKGDEDIFSVIEEWRHKDRLRYEQEANLRDQLVAHRREVYRLIAKELVASCGTIVLEDTSLPSIQRKGRAEDDPDPMAERARAQARLAAPGSLREQLRLVIEREGTKCIVAPTYWTTRVHASCGTTLDQDTATSLVLWCPRCETSFDQDINATINLINFACGEFQPPSKAPSS